MKAGGFGMRRDGPRILVVDGDPAIRFYLHKSLKAEGYAVAEAARGGTALHAAAEAPPALIILAVELPDMDGMDLIRTVRETSPVPIIVLSTRADEDVAVEALERGADDVVRKPFGLRELVARVRNALRRTAQGRGETPHFAAGDLEVDLIHRRVRVRDQEVHLSKTEYEVLRLLVEGDGKVLTHQELLETVWGSARANPVQYLRVVIRALRRKVDGDPERPGHILTEPRVGYRLRVSAPGVAARSATRKRTA